MVADLLLGIVLFFQFDPNLYEMQFAELKARWFDIGGLTVNYSVGMDGISFLLVELTLLLGPVVILSSWSAIQERVKEYHILMLILQTGMIGAFVALDFFLFYVFWELMLIPMYFLIGIWGGGRKIYAAIKFFLFTMAGSVLMLVAIVYVVLQPELRTFDIVTITNSLAEHPLRPDLQILLFAAFAVAFAIKVPMFPFHTWLPDAHVEAPTAGSVILAGVLLKMGTYGFIRFAMPLFPYGVYESMTVVMVLALIGIIYGALVSMMQDDVKKLVAYSSVSHLGFVMLGLFALTSAGVQGALIQMVNHGLSTGALFLLVGVLYERRHTRLLSDYGGIWAKVPIFGSFFIITALSSAGLPGMNGFVGEFTILLGTFRVNVAYAAVATFGIVLAAWYLLTAVRRALFGPLNPANADLADMTPREIAVMLPLVAFFFVIGLFPNLFFEKINPATEGVASRAGQTVVVVERGHE